MVGHGCGEQIVGARECIEAALADAAMARRLEVAPGICLLVARRRSHAEDQRPIEYAIMHYRADRYRFIIELAGNRPLNGHNDRSFPNKTSSRTAKPQVLPPKPNALERLFRVRKPIIGVIHLPALPGAPRYDGQSMSEIYAAAEADAKTLSKEGWMESSLKTRATCLSLDPSISGRRRSRR